MEGLYSGGEASGGIHGANRTGGAALADSYVFGLRSGMGAACEAKGRERPDPEGGGWREGFERLEERANRAGGRDVDEVRKEVQRVGAVSIGQIRDGERLERALGELDDLQRENGRYCAEKVGFDAENPRDG